VKNHHTLSVHQFVFDYRGYGQSGAAPPTEAGLVADALAAFEYLQVGNMGNDTLLRQ
jgi:alpha/beta superfamily hydrolase